MPTTTLLGPAKAPVGSARTPVGSARAPVGPARVILASHGPPGVSQGPIQASQIPIEASQGPLGPGMGPLKPARALWGQPGPLGARQGPSCTPLCRFQVVWASPNLHWCFPCLATRVHGQKPRKYRYPGGFEGKSLEFWKLLAMGCVAKNFLLKTYTSKLVFDHKSASPVKRWVSRLSTPR